jgi:8-oxo-dGTP pyrophosphatase MutT (NUDIX family)
MEVHVVTAFLAYRDKILILKRSQRVSTYKGKWGAVSGHLEEGESPVERAFEEIKEETGIEDAKFLREGGSFKVIDPELKRDWVVYPLLFKVSKDKVKMDWEHSDFKWISPREIKNYETVPMLEEGLKRVLKQ